VSQQRAMVAPSKFDPPRCIGSHARPDLPRGMGARPRLPHRCPRQLRPRRGRRAGGVRHAADRWPGNGIPSNPRAWLMPTARNRATDRIRREQATPPSPVCSKHRGWRHRGQSPARRPGRRRRDPPKVCDECGGCGGRGIRTPGPLAGPAVFKTAPINRSGIPPRWREDIAPALRQTVVRQRWRPVARPGRGGGRCRSWRSRSRGSPR
jgi:hypothetical protein